MIWIILAAGAILAGIYVWLHGRALERRLECEEPFPTGPFSGTGDTFVDSEGRPMSVAIDEEESRG